MPREHCSVVASHDPTAVSSRIQSLLLNYYTVPRTDVEQEVWLASYVLITLLYSMYVGCT